MVDAGGKGGDWGFQSVWLFIVFILHLRYRFGCIFIYSNWTFAILRTSLVIKLRRSLGGLQLQKITKTDMHTYVWMVNFIYLFFFVYFGYLKKIKEYIKNNNHDFHDLIHMIFGLKWFRLQLNEDK